MTAVVDASALAEMVTERPAADAITDLLAGHAGDLHVPHLAMVETTSVLRGWLRSDQITQQRAMQALVDLARFPARRWEADTLLPRIWALRDNLTAHDATYLALAESLDAVLVTRDDRLRRAAQNVTSAAVVVA